MEHYLEKELYKLVKSDKNIFNFILEASPDGLWFRDLEKPDNEWLNARFWQILGYNPEEMPHLASSWQDIIHKDDLKIARENFTKHLNDPEYPYDQVVRYRHKNGSTVWVRCKGLAIRNKGGKAIRMLGSNQDITALKQTEDRYKSIFENAPIAIQLLDIKGDIIDINPQWLKILGYTREEVVGKWFGEFLHEAYQDTFKAYYRKAKKQSVFDDVQFKMLKKNGAHIYVSFQSNPELDKNREFKQSYSTFRDISKEKETENKLIHSEEEYRVLAENAKHLIFTHDFDGKITYANSFALQFMGMQKEQVIGLDIALFITNREDLKLMQQRMQNFASGKYLTHQYEININLPGGEKRILEVSGNPIKGKNNKLSVLIVAYDITARKTAELRIIENEEKLRLTIDNSPLGVCINDLNGKFISTNPRYEKMLGYSKEELQNLTLYDVTHPEDRLINREKYKGMAHKKFGRFSMEKRYIRKNGTELNVAIHAERINDTKDNPPFGLAFVEDITARKEAENRIRESEEKFRGLFQHANIGIALGGLNGCATEVNDEYLQILGYSRKEFMGISFADITHPEDLEKEIPLLEKVQTGKINNYRLEKRLKKKDGHYIWTNSAITVIQNLSGAVDMIVAMVIDITKSKKNEEKYKNLVENMQDMVYRYELVPKQKFTYLSPNTTKITGYSPQEHFEDPQLWQKIIHPDDLHIMEEYMSNITKQKNSLILRWISKEGAIIWIEQRNRPIYNDRGHLIALEGITRDISKQKEIEKELENSKELLRLTIEGANLGIWVWDLPSGELFLNDNWFKLKGYQPNEIKPTLKWWEEQIHPEDKVSAQKALEDHLKDQNKQYESEFRVKTKSGNWVWISDRGKVIERDLKGNPIRMSGIHIDTTERKLAEQKITDQNTDYEILNEELKQTNKALFTAKEKAEGSDRLKTEFLHNMSHEIRTPMNGIMGFSSLFSKSGVNSEKRAYYASIVQNSSKQLLRIIDDILEISTLETKQLKIKEETFSLNAFIMELFSIFDLKSKERKIPLYVKKALPDKESHIVTDKAKLRKIMDNLLENAIKFTSEGLIELGYYIESSALLIYVKDSGTGISQKNRKKIFERFSQGDEEKANHNGLGLGLSISKENAQLLGGEIILESEEGKGSTFILSIPYKPVQSMSENPKAASPTYTILIAEDEEVNFLYLEAVFQDFSKANAKLIHAKNGKEALDICLSDVEVHLVLMDIKMPVMDGYEASMKIRAALPNLPIIAQTAYSTEADEKQALKHGCNHFISKPIDTQNLFDLITKYLKPD